MAKRNLSKKPKRKQLSRKLKRKTLNRKKVGKGGNRGGGMQQKDYDNVIGAIIMLGISLIMSLVYLKVSKDTASQGGGPVLNNDLYNSLLNNECLNQHSKFYEKIKTLYIENKFEITNDYELIINDKELSQNEFLKKHITGNRIHIKNMSKDNITRNITSFIHEIESLYTKINSLYPKQDLINIDCINKKVEELNKTPTSSRLQ